MLCMENQRTYTTLHVSLLRSFFESIVRIAGTVTEDYTLCRPIPTELIIRKLPDKIYLMFDSIGRGYYLSVIRVISVSWEAQNE